MCRHHLFLLLCGLSLGLAPVRAGDKDGQLLDGKWKLVSADCNGAPLYIGHGKRADVLVGKTFVVFSKGEMAITIDGTKALQKASYRIDKNHTPKRIDFTAIDESDEVDKLFKVKLFRDQRTGKGPDAEGIFAMEGNRLKLCWRATKLKDRPLRPQKFASDLYYHQVLLVLERVKS